MLAKYLPQMKQISADWFSLGQEDPSDRGSQVVMTVFALKLAKYCNGVSKLHGEVSRQMWQHLFGAESPDDVPIGSITNGVHSETWLAPEIRPLYDKYLKPKWLGAGPRDDWWKNATRIPAPELWAARGMLRARLRALRPPAIDRSDHPAQRIDQ